MAVAERSGEAGCGLASNEAGLLELWAPSLAEIFEMAAALIARRECFDRLGAPRWRAAEDVSSEDAVELHAGQQDLF